MLEDKGYATKLYSDKEVQPEQCDVFMKYTARRSWDIVPYLSLAEINLYDKDGFKIAGAKYRHRGGFAFNKWASIETKMTPVLTQLLPNRTRL
ncbi:hypothetical protein C9I90_06325 [Photobacterium aphoticum]|nr:hypothetical protein C9I90_06325 [Photobacterium aphoticum]